MTRSVESIPYVRPYDMGGIILLRPVFREACSGNDVTSIGAPHADCDIPPRTFTLSTHVLHRRTRKKARDQLNLPWSFRSPPLALR